MSLVKWFNFIPESYLTPLQLGNLNVRIRILGFLWSSDLTWHSMAVTFKDGVILGMSK